MNIDDRMAFGTPTEAEAIAYEYDRIRSIERAAVVEFLRRQAASIDDRSDRSDAADALLTVAMCIEAGDHRR